jgi:hypothetical protein
MDRKDGNILSTTMCNCSLSEKLYLSPKELIVGYVTGSITVDSPFFSVFTSVSVCLTKAVSWPFVIKKNRRITSCEAFYSMSSVKPSSLSSYYMKLT